MNNIARKILANNLLNLRQAIKYTQEDMSNAIGLSTRGYARIERGESDVRISTIEKIAETFDTTACDLLSDRFNPENCKPQYFDFHI